MSKKASIIGSGFAALSAARRLRRLDAGVRISLIAPRRELIYLPSLIWLPSGKRKPEDLVVPLDKFLRAHDIDFVAGEATGLADGGRTVLTAAGPTENDGLIIACGGRFIKKLPGIEHAILPCEGIAPVERLRERVAALQSGTVALGFAGNPNEPTAMRGGPIFEFLLGLDTQLRREGRRQQIKLAFFNPMPNPGNRLGEQALKRLMGEMQRRDIATHLGHKLLGFEPGKVKTEGGEFAADIIVFMPGHDRQCLVRHYRFAAFPRRPDPGRCALPRRRARVRLCGGRRRQFPRPRLDAQAGTHGRHAGRGGGGEPAERTGRPRTGPDLRGRTHVHRRQPRCRHAGAAHGIGRVGLAAAEADAWRHGSL
jgi:hypothetical protein